MNTVEEAKPTKRSSGKIPAGVRTPSSTFICMQCFMQLDFINKEGMCEPLFYAEITGKEKCKVCGQIIADIVL